MENSQLLEYIGETRTQKLIDSIQSEYKELQKKQFPNSKNLTKTCCVITVSNKNESEIKSIGMSCINDLFLDNFGQWFSLIFGGQSGIFPFVNSGGGTNTMFIVRALTKYNTTGGLGGAVGARVRIGNGSNPATRSDFNIQSSFGSSPESAENNVGSASYQVGLSKVTIPIIITPTGGSGSIREAVLFGRWVNQNSNTVGSFAVSRDNISPVVNFVAGQTINIEYGILI